MRVKSPYNKKCNRAYIVLFEQNVARRIRKCECASEFGFALLLRFVQLEAALKIIRYWERAKDGWPDRLDFLHANWKPLRDLKATDKSKYDTLIGAGGQSLREARNRIAHEGHCLDQKQYDSFASVADWALEKLKARVPPKHEMPKKVARINNRNVKIPKSS